MRTAQPIQLLLLILFSICIQIVAAQTYTVETVPNTKLVNNSYVSNPDTILNEATVSAINKKLSDLEAKTTVQVAVVVIKSIGDADIFDFAQRLFNTWGIGKSGKDNGLLVLMVLDKRTVRFHTGYGLEGMLPDIACKHIEMQEMIPYFKVEDYNQGMLSGINKLSFVLTNPKFLDELRDESRKADSGWDVFFFIILIVGSITFLIWFLVMQLAHKFADSKKYDKKKVTYPEMRMKRLEWIILFGIIPFGILLFYNYATIDTSNYILSFCIVIYGYFILTLIYKRIRMKKVVDRLLAKNDFHGATEFFQSYQTYWLVMSILFLPVLVLFFLFLGRKKYFRNHPRNCKSCGTPLRKLDEKADDQYLKKSQVFEEELKSVDYDVWLCSNCNRTEILNYVNRFSKYDACPQCKARAFFKESDRTLSPASYTSTGTGQITKKCKFCNHIDVSTYTIAMLTPPSSSSDSSGSSSSSSSSGSWGGGSSGGGGANSSW